MPDFSCFKRHHPNGISRQDDMIAIQFIPLIDVADGNDDYIVDMKANTSKGFPFGVDMKANTSKSFPFGLQRKE